MLAVSIVAVILIVILVIRSILIGHSRNRKRRDIMKGKIRVKKADDDMVYAVKTTKLVGEKEVAALMERKDHIRQLRKEHRHREAQEKLGKR